MPVLSYDAHLLDDQQEIYQFLFACKQVALEQERTQIVSLSVAADSEINPLTVLQCLEQPQQLHFYFEHAASRDSELELSLETFYPWREGATTQADVGQGVYAIAAIDAAVYLKTDGPQRFSLAQEFIQSSLADTILAGNLNLPFAGPQFFCSFTFFDDNPHQQAAFPAATVFLPRWQVIRCQQQVTVVANVVISPESNLQALAKKLWQGLDIIRSTPQSWQELSTIQIPAAHFSKRDVVGSEQFKAAVDSALEAIQSDYFRKIVLSHAIDIASPLPIHWARAISNLRRLNPNCYIFSTSNGQGQTFIGASPERLLSLHNSQLLTDALAGSAPRGKTQREDLQHANYLLANEKELHEHQIVIDFIRLQLSRLGMKPHLFTTQPRLLQLPNIQHLRTTIQAQVPADIHLLEILADLHPTPAVAGTPREIACREIRRFESFERGLFAAPLGWVDYQGNGEFIVGIRSALIDGYSARLYAGAGIVAGSNAEQEFTEVNLKLQALLKALS